MRTKNTLHLTDQTPTVRASMNDLRTSKTPEGVYKPIGTSLYSNDRIVKLTHPITMGLVLLYVDRASVEPAVDECWQGYTFELTTEKFSVNINS